MSFYTSLYYYRPTKPPRVTGPVLAAFLRELSATALFERKGPESLKVKFGRAIDQDTRPSSWEVPVRGVPGMCTFDGIDWDIEHERLSLDDALAVLSNHDRPVYRASAGLGYLRQDITRTLQTLRPDDGAPNLCLGDCSVWIEPIELGQMSDDATYKVGWMGVSFSGYGYLYPWTARDVTDRALASPDLRRVADVCRRLFPVDPNGTPSLLERLTPERRRSRITSIRKRMRDLWPFDDLDAPWDWYWGVLETG